MDKREYDAKVTWLRRYRQAVRRQELLAEALAEQRARAERITPLLDPGAAGSARGGATRADKLPRAVESILAAQAELEAQIGHCEAVRAEVRAVLEQERDPQRYEILYRRYILGQGFAQAAAALHIEVRWAYRLHRQSLEQLDFDQ